MTVIASGERSGRELLDDDGAVRVRGEPETAVVPRDDHPEEALVLEELPDFGRQVATLVARPSRRSSRQTSATGSVDERLFFGRQVRVRRVAEVP